MYKRSPDFPPDVSYISPPTPPDNATVSVGQNVSVRAQYYDDDEPCINATLFWKNSSALDWNWQPMTNITIWNGSYDYLFEANFSEAAETSVSYLVNCTNSAGLTGTTKVRTIIFKSDLSGDGFFWRPLSGWNLVSVPKDTRAKYGASFMASDVGLAVLDAAKLYNVSLNALFISRRLPGPLAMYESFDGIQRAGNDFALEIDKAYWLFVDQNITAVWIESDELVSGDPVTGISASGINTVYLDEGWNLVNSGLNSTSSEWGHGLYAPIYTDAAGHTGNIASNSTILYSGGGWIPDIYLGWYDQPSVGPPTHIADAQDNNPPLPGTYGYLLDTATCTLTQASTWSASEQKYELGCVYGDDIGLWNYGSGQANEGKPIYYASGFWVYAGNAGIIQYDING